MGLPTDPTEFNDMARKLADQTGVSVEEATASLLRTWNNMQTEQKPSFRERFKAGVRTVTQPMITALDEAQANRTGYQPIANTLNRVARGVLTGWDTPEGVALTALPYAGPVAGKVAGAASGVAPQAAATAGRVIRTLDPYAGGMPKMLLGAPAVGAGTAAVTGGDFNDIAGGALSGAVQGVAAAGTRGGQKLLFPESVDMGNRLVKGIVSDVPELMPAFTKAPTIGVMLQRAPERIQGVLSGRYQTMVDDIVTAAGPTQVQLPMLGQFRGRVVDPTVGQPKIVTRTTLSDSDRVVTRTKLGPNTTRVQSQGSSSSVGETQPPAPKVLDLDFSLDEALRLYQTIGRKAKGGQVEVTVAPGDKQMVGTEDLREAIKNEIVGVLQANGRPDLGQQFLRELGVYNRGIKVKDFVEEARKGMMFSSTHKDLGGAKPRELQEMLNFRGPEYGLTADAYPTLYREVLRGAMPGASATNPRDPFLSVPTKGGRLGMSLNRDAPPVGQAHSSVPPRLSAIPAMPVSDYVRSMLLTNPAAGVE